MRKRVTSTNLGVESANAYCRECSWSTHGQHGRKDAKRAVGRARYHAESTGHAVSVYRESLSVVKKITPKEQP